MNDEEIRLECLKQALGSLSICQSHQTAVERAAVFADFVLGKNDAKIVRAARDLAGKVDAGDARQGRDGGK